MKTSFTKLFTTVAVAIALAGGLFASPAQAQGLIGQILHEVLEHRDGHHGHHHPHNNGNFNNGPFIQPVFQQPIAQAGIPQWLVGTWTLNDGRMGGRTEFEISANGRFTKVVYALTQNGPMVVARQTMTASYGRNGLVVDGQLFQLTSTTPGVINLTSNGTTLQLVQAVQPVNGGIISSGPINNGPINNTPINNGQGGQVIQVTNLVVGSSVPAAMQGTWYEVTTEQGEPILNRYDLNADGSYEMFQYAISAQGQVNLGSPTAQLSQSASAQQRTVTLVNGVLSLGAGQSFAEGPYNAALSGSKLTLTSNSGTRTWTRNP